MVDWKNVSKNLGFTVAGGVLGYFLNEFHSRKSLSRRRWGMITKGSAAFATYMFFTHAMPGCLDGCNKKGERDYQLENKRLDYTHQTDTIKLNQDYNIKKQENSDHQLLQHVDSTLDQKLSVLKGSSDENAMNNPARYSSNTEQTAVSTEEHRIPPRQLPGRIYPMQYSRFIAHAGYHPSIMLGRGAPYSFRPRRIIIYQRHR